MVLKNQLFVDTWFLHFLVESEKFEKCGLLFTPCSAQTRRFCLMHSNHLGIYHIVNAEGLLILAENKQRRWACSLEEALRHCFCDFRHWCSRNKIRCSHRRWSVKKLNITDAKGLPSFPSLDGKAFNSRVILAFLADPSHIIFLSWASYSPQAKQIV